MADLLIGLAVCAVIAWVVCVPLAKLTGDYDTTRFDTTRNPRETGNVHVPRSTYARLRRR